MYGDKYMLLKSGYLLLVNTSNAQYPNTFNTPIQLPLYQPLLHQLLLFVDYTKLLKQNPTPMSYILERPAISSAPPRTDTVPGSENLATKNQIQRPENMTAT
ncbi:hypothetical protein Droror1_Dr00022146 [Drosera rotundifolia]